MAPFTLVETPDDDPARTYSTDEQRRLTQQLEHVTTQLHDGAWIARPLTLDLLRHFHWCVFDGVRGHAGKFRGRGFGAEYLTFGPNRSVHRDAVESELAKALAVVERESPKLLEMRATDDETFEEEAIKLAVWCHAEIIRIHPFEDGNGRTSRLVAGHLLLRFGLWPVPIEAVKQEYTEALNRYHAAARELEPLVDLFIRLYPFDR